MNVKFKINVVLPGMISDIEESKEVERLLSAIQPEPIQTYQSWDEWIKARGEF